MYHPSRGGVRGGRDQFNWDDVKGDKHRENYLGHSIKAPVGRWQKGKDLHWYTRDKHSEGAAAREEIKRIQEEEHDAMQEMLGLAPKKVNRQQGNQLDEREVTELLKKVKDGDESAPSYAAGERVQGLGFAPAPAQTAPGQTGAKRTVSDGYEKGSALLTTDQRSLEISRDVGEENVRQDGLEIVEVPAPIIAESEDERNTSSSEEEQAARRKRKEERRRAKEQQRETKRACKQARKEGKLKRSRNKVQSDGYLEETDEDKHIKKHDGAEWESSRGYSGRSFSHIDGQSRKGDLPKERSYKTFNARHDRHESEGSGQETQRKTNIHANELFSRDSRSHHGSDGKGKVKHDGNKEMEERRGQAGKRSPTGTNVDPSRHSLYKEKSGGSGKVRYDSEDSETSEQLGGRRAFSSPKAHSRRHLSYNRRSEDRAQVRHDTEKWKERKGGASWHPSQNGVSSRRNSPIKKRSEDRGRFKHDSEDSEGSSEGSRGDARRKGPSNTNVHSKIDSHYKQRREDIVHGRHYAEDGKIEASPGNNMHCRSSLYDEKNEGRGKFRYDSADREGSRQGAGSRSSIPINVHTRRELPYKERSDGKELHKSEEREEGKRRMQIPKNLYSQSSYLGAQNGHARNDEQGTLSEYSGEDDQEARWPKTDMRVLSRNWKRKLSHYTDEKDYARSTDARR